MPQAQQQQQNDKKKTQGDGDAAGGKQKGAQQLTGAKLRSAVSYNKSRQYSKDKIRSVQRTLNVGVDGTMGPETTQAIYAFQVSRPGIANDGKLGPSTLRTLATDGPAKGEGGGSSDLTQHQIMSALRYNRGRAFKRSQVRRVQNFIGVPDDGIFGPITIREIARWQIGKGLIADGKVGGKTLEAMGITYNEEPYQQPDPTPIETGPIPEGNLTSNFTWAEFATNDGTPVPSNLRGNAVRVAQQLEVLRKEVGGRAITINSAYRHPAYNRRVGGASSSQHLYAKAVDIRVAGMSPRRVHSTILKLIKGGKLLQGGVGRYNSFTHYDIRGTAARW